MRMEEEFLAAEAALASRGPALAAPGGPAGFLSLGASLGALPLSDPPGSLRATGPPLSRSGSEGLPPPPPPLRRLVPSLPALPPSRLFPPPF